MTKNRKTLLLIVQMNARARLPCFSMEQMTSEMIVAQKMDAPAVVR